MSDLISCVTYIAVVFVATYALCWVSAWRVADALEAWIMEILDVLSAEERQVLLSRWGEVIPAVRVRSLITRTALMFAGCSAFVWFGFYACWVSR